MTKTTYVFRDGRLVVKPAPAPRDVPLFLTAWTGVDRDNRFLRMYDGMDHEAFRREYIGEWLPETDEES